MIAVGNVMAGENEGSKVVYIELKSYESFEGNDIIRNGEGQKVVRHNNPRCNCHIRGLCLKF